MAKPGAIKISLGAKKTTASIGPQANKPTSVTPQQRKPRAKFSLEGDEDEEDEIEGKTVEVTHFDEKKGGAHHADVKSPLRVASQGRIIKCQPNKNWRDEATRKRQKSALPGGARFSCVPCDEDKDGVMVAGDMKYGLNTKPNNSDDGVLVPHLDEDDLRRQPTMQNISFGLDGLDEERAYEDDLERAPEAPSYGDYEKVPVEGFGLAMLKGMGFKEDDGEKETGKDKEGANVPVKRRPALLGIGAKPMEAEEKKE